MTDHIRNVVWAVTCGSTIASVASALWLAQAT